MARLQLPTKYSHRHKSSLNPQLSLEDIGIELASCVSSGHWTGERMMQGFWRVPRLVPQPAPSVMAARGPGLGAGNQISR